MPLLTDKTAIRAILCRDPAWGVYALGDLAPRMFPKTQWFAPGLGPDLALVLHDFDTSILFAIGTGAVREALEHVRWPVHLQVQQDALDEAAQYAVIEKPCQMWRMSWNGPATAGQHMERSRAVRLGPADVPALLRLYADGEATGEAPDFFYPSMVTAGVFFGVYDGDALVAAAGTHLFAPEERAVAIGNIYTRRDCRGRGLGAAVTRAVLEAVKDSGTIGLNVRAHNHAALRLYESLGFVRHCSFYEGLATVRK